MKVYDFINQDNVQELQLSGHYSILPTDSVILLNFSFSKLAQLNNILKTSERFVFIDWSYDPIEHINHRSISLLTSEVEKKFNSAKCIVLSSKCADYYTDQSNILWYPFFLLQTHEDNPVTPRQKRVGCLNRRNAVHRVWLMHNLISKGLIDHNRDIFSIAFANIYDNNRCELANWISLSSEEKEIVRQYPNQITTIDDGFINDHTVTHPAWNTAITIIPETEVEEKTLITEKTVKGIVGRCCWMLYAGEDQFKVLTSLGFDINLFEKHASGHNIEPIITMCQTLDNESTAMDYYHSKIDKINHNYDWYRNGWLDVYLKKLNDVLK